MAKPNKNSTVIKKLREARSIKQLLDILAPVADSVAEIEDNAEALLKSVSSVRTVSIKLDMQSLSNARELGDLLDDAAPTKTRRSGTRIPSMRAVLENFEAPDLKHLQRDSKALDRLSQDIAELEVAEQVLMSGSLSDMSGRSAALKSIQALKKQAKEALDKQLAAMAKIAKKTKPKPHTGIVAACIKHLESILDKGSYSGIESKTFIYPTGADSSVIHYQTYIFINDFMNEEGHVYDSYAFVLTGILDMDTGELHHALTAVKDHMVPGSFAVGKTVENSSELKRRINTLLAVDSFRAHQDRKVLKHTTKHLKNSSLPESSSSIKSVGVRNDEVWVSLVPGLTDAEEKSALESIMGSLSTIFRSKLQGSRNSIQRIRAISRRDGRPVYRFYITAQGKRDKAEINANKLRQIADVLELTPQQIASIKQSL